MRVSMPARTFYQFALILFPILQDGVATDREVPREGARHRAPPGRQRDRSHQQGLLQPQPRPHGHLQLHAGREGSTKAIKYRSLAIKSAFTEG